jgi:hypothetical protein
VTDDTSETSTPGRIVLATTPAGETSPGKFLILNSKGGMIVGADALGHFTDRAIEANGDILAATINTNTNKVINGTFSSSLNWTWGTGWSRVSSAALHTPGNTAALEQDISVTAGKFYYIGFVVSATTDGNITVSLGGTSYYPLHTSGGSIITFRAIIKATNTGTLQFIPSTDFDGAIDTVIAYELSAGSIEAVASVIAPLGNFGKVMSNSMIVASDNATAAAAGVSVGEMYRTNADPSVVCIRTA